MKTVNQPAFRKSASICTMIILAYFILNAFVIVDKPSESTNSEVYTQQVK